MGHHESPLRASLASARAAAISTVAVTGSEQLNSAQAVGRVLAESVFARFGSPHYRAAAMDGIAVRAADTEAAAEGVRVIVEPFAGEGVPPSTLAACRAVDTGTALPEWADAVVRIEDVRRADGGFEIRAAVPVGRDVRAVGEDISAGTLLFTRGHVLRPLDLGALLATGVADVVVRKRPRIGVVTTGAEVIELPLGEGTPAPGQVIEFNARVLAAQAAVWGADAVYLGRADDNPRDLARLLENEIVRHDVLCVIAGSSAGRKDITIEALAACGELLFHGVDLVPGRPAALARLEGKPVLAVPGYPASAFAVYCELLKPLVDAALGRQTPRARVMHALVRSHIPSRLGVEELVRVCLAFEGPAVVAAVLPRGASRIGALVGAHGLIRIGPAGEGIAAGSSVEVEMLDGDFDPSRTIVAGGRPDLFTAALQEASDNDGEPAFTIVHLGRASHDACAALESGEAHLAAFDDDYEREPTRGERIYRAEDSGGVVVKRIVLTETLVASPIGARLCAVLEGDAMRDATARIGGVRSRITRAD